MRFRRWVTLVAGAGVMGITRLGPQEARAEPVLGLALTLQTAPRL